jgi:hypothetical protein
MLIAILLGNGTWHASQPIRLVTRLPLETENFVAYNELCVQFYPLRKVDGALVGAGSLWLEGPQWLLRLQRKNANDTSPNTRRQCDFSHTKGYGS